MHIYIPPIYVYIYIYMRTTHLCIYTYHPFIYIYIHTYHPFMYKYVPPIYIRIYIHTIHLCIYTYHPFMYECVPPIYVYTVYIPPTVQSLFSVILGIFITWRWTVCTETCSNNAHILIIKKPLSSDRRISSIFLSLKSLRNEPT
jgi:hypothetical protein